MKDNKGKTGKERQGRKDKKMNDKKRKTRKERQDKNENKGKT